MLTVALSHTPFKRKLNLAPIKQRDILIQTFANIDLRDILEQVELCVISNDDKDILIQCFVKDISAPLISQNSNLAKPSPYLINMKLAADSNINK